LFREKPRVWSGKQLANLGTSRNYDLAPDGKRFVVLMPVERPAPRETQRHVTLVVNFFDEVRRRVAGRGKAVRGHPQAKRGGLCILPTAGL
jgi:hypothetical protein